jgi:23S rRNA pseudouridine1911/1915/1917 synthase
VLDILYEDEAILFVDKPPGIVVQRSHDATEPVLVEVVAEYLGGKGERCFLMQRLDRGTTGVIFFTKLASVNAAVTRQFERKRLRKGYLALAEGRLGEAQTIDAPLARIGPISFGVRAGGKRSTTSVTPLASGPRASFLEVHLQTGRTHQIRVHLAAIGHPLVGDWLYGERNASRPMLHAATIEMIHPLTQARLAVSSPLPEDFLAAARERGVVIDSP